MNAEYDSGVMYIYCEGHQGQQVFSPALSILGIEVYVREKKHLFSRDAGFFKEPLINQVYPERMTLAKAQKRQETVARMKRKRNPGISPDSISFHPGYELASLREKLHFGN